MIVNMQAAELPVRQIERNPDGTWRVELDARHPDPWRAAACELLAHLAGHGAETVHLTGPSAHELPRAALAVLAAAPLSWVLHVPAHLYDPDWLVLADQITAHVVPGLSPSTQLTAAARRRRVVFAHCPLD
jgi:hypothetical protein